MIIMIIIILIINSMEKWKVMLCSGNSEVGEVELSEVFFKEILYPL